MIAAPEAEAATLDAALREAARAGRAEATLLDLWLHRPGGANLSLLERPAPGARTNWHALVALAGDGGGVLDLGGGKDVPLFAAFGEEEEEEIVVKGSKPNSVDEGGDGNMGGPGGGFYPGGPEGPGVGEGGGNLPDPDPSPDLSHDETCATADGAAKQIADAIRDAPAVPGRRDWTQVEMGTFVVGTAGGRFGALESTIYTDNQTEGVNIPNVWGDDYVEGIVHNHPNLLGNNQVDLVNRYPSTADWAAAAALYNAYSPHYPGYDPSIWIMDSAGVLREFKFSERAAVEGLTDTQKRAGEGLEGRERTNSCS